MGMVPFDWTQDFQLSEYSKVLRPDFLTIVPKELEVSKICDLRSTLSD